MRFPSPAGIVAGLCVAASLAWIALFVHSAIHRRKAIRLADLPSDEPVGGWPRVAVIVAARDEEAEVGDAVRSLLALDYPGLALVAVDDRSADRTGTILDELAARDGRLRVVHVGELPEGWLGKTNAMRAGADAEPDATFYLFTDADVIFAPGALRRAIVLAERDRLDHLVVGPQTTTQGVGERLFMALFTLLMMLKAPLGWVGDPRRKTSIGVGAFNLVRASAFRAIGGFGRIALSVDDDMRLGQALKYAGYRNALVLGDRDVSLRWQVGLGGMVRGLEKNFFAALDFRPGVAVYCALIAFVLAAGPIAGLFVGPTWCRVVCGLGVAVTAFLLGVSSGSSGVGAHYAVTLPLAGLVIAYALLRSTALTLRRGGVSWRGTLYPLARLEAHTRLRNHWLNEIWHSTR